MRESGGSVSGEKVSPVIRSYAEMYRSAAPMRTSSRHRGRGPSPL